MHVPLIADRFLARFFADRRHALHGDRRERLRRVESDLRLAIEVAAEELLDADDRVLLDAEREFDRIGAAARIMTVAVLPRALQRFVVDPLYRPVDADEARERLDTCAALLRRLAREPDLTSSSRVLRWVDEAIRMQGALLTGRKRPSRRVRG